MLSALIVHLENNAPTPHLTLGTPAYMLSQCLAAHAPEIAQVPPGARCSGRLLRWAKQGPFLPNASFLHTTTSLSAHLQQFAAKTELSNAEERTTEIVRGASYAAFTRQAPPIQIQFADEHDNAICAATRGTCRCRRLRSGGAQWKGTHVKPIGGILTVKSELGEPIRKVATRSVKLWDEFDDSVFKLDEKRAAWLLEHRDEIIRDLNRNFSTLWFGCKKDGSVANELGSLGGMTYEETVLRVSHLLVSPVPFIPVLDATFEVWFKQDSLWAAKDTEAVFDRDPQRVRIQGPMAVKHSKVRDEPIKDPFGNIHNELAHQLLASTYGGDLSKVPTVDYLNAPLAAPPAIRPMHQTRFGERLPKSSV
uniref:Fatty acid synthase beta subunit AflB /Fas1-like central domain-containing protein n=1 Tax=Mycena chlorophos TaxID=658473 RepID=A0ABQ0M7S7_MYCCL|nr:predicted protein [Mycena chlorophos]